MKKHECYQGCDVCDELNTTGARFFQNIVALTVAVVIIIVMFCFAAITKDSAQKSQAINELYARCVQRSL